MPNRWLGPLPTEPQLLEAGRLRVHVGMLPGCGQMQGLVRAYRMAQEQKQRVVVLPSVFSEEEGWVFPHAAINKLFGAKTGLWNSELVDDLLARKPHLVIFDSLNQPGLTAEQHEAQREAIGRLLKAGVSVETSLDIVAVAMVGDLLNPNYVWPENAKVSMTFLRHLVNDYVVHDVTPLQFLQRLHEGKVNFGEPLRSQRMVFADVANLSRLREAMFRMVGSHVTDQVLQTSPAADQLYNPQDWLRKATLPWLYLVTGVAAISGILSTAYGQTIGITHMVVLAGGISVIFIVLLLALYGHLKAALTSETVLRYKDLLRLAYDLTSADTVEKCIEVGIKNLEKNWVKGVLVVLETGDGPQVYPEQQKLTPGERRVQRRAVASNSFQRPENASQRYYFCPLAFLGRVIGTFALPRAQQENIPDPLFETISFLRDYGNLLAGAIVRTQLKTFSVQAGEQASKESLRSALLSSISHDLKTPLVSIIGSLSTLEHVSKGLPEEEQQELVHNARQEAERLHSIIHNVLEVTKLESGSLKPRREVVEMTDILDEAVARAARYYPGFRIDIRKVAALPDVWVDPILVGQVLHNLLDNAAKHGGGGKATIALKPNGTQLVVQVRDQGPGIRPGEEEKIFDKFFRSGKRDRNVAGSGLGLAICRGIVEAHGGSIRAENRAKGSGAVFTLKLPLAPKLKNSRKRGMSDE